MPNRRKNIRKPVLVAAVSGGPDSTYLLRKLSSGKGIRVVVGHVNYGLRGADSEKDKESVDTMAKTYGYEMHFHEPAKGDGSRTEKEFPAGFERKAREVRYRFLRDLSEKTGADAIAVAHTADDQVETVLMRIFEGAGIGGLKGIPRTSAGGVVRPILDEWKADILGSLERRKIPYRVDRSNFDTRFERNWVRTVLVPLLVKRYGKAIKKRIFTLGERFRELDDYIAAEAGKWVRRNLKPCPGRSGERDMSLPRERYGRAPTVLRIKILQGICFDRLGVSPNERLLVAMDRSIRAGGPSARVVVGKGWELANRYDEAVFLKGERRQGWRDELVLEAKGKITPSMARRLAARGDAEVFDASVLKLPLAIRPLRAGDRILPFGAGAAGVSKNGGKRVKEILIDRKVPREERWGRPAVCDADGRILWVPGLIRSAHAPVTPTTRKTAVLRVRSRK